MNPSERFMPTFDTGGECLVKITFSSDVLQGPEKKPQPLLHRRFFLRLKVEPNTYQYNDGGNTLRLKCMEPVT